MLSQLSVFVGCRAETALVWVGGDEGAKGRWDASKRALSQAAATQSLVSE